MGLQKLQGFVALVGVLSTNGAEALEDKSLETNPNKAFGEMVRLEELPKDTNTVSPFTNLWRDCDAGVDEILSSIQPKPKKEPPFTKEQLTRIADLINQMNLSLYPERALKNQLRENDSYQDPEYWLEFNERLATNAENQ